MAPPRKPRPPLYDVSREIVHLTCVSPTDRTLGFSTGRDAKCPRCGVQLKPPAVVIEVWRVVEKHAPKPRATNW